MGDTMSVNVVTSNNEVENAENKSSTPTHETTPTPTTPTKPTSFTLPKNVKSAMDLMNMSCDTQIDLGDKVGDYVDFLQPADLPKPICYFYDKYFRSGLVLKVCLRDEFKGDTDPDRVYVLTFAQRYTGDLECFRLCVNHDKVFGNYTPAVVGAIVKYFESRNINYKFHEYNECYEDLLPPCIGLHRTDTKTVERLVRALIFDLDPILRLCG